jgi:hypothetical protein
VTECRHSRFGSRSAGIVNCGESEAKEEECPYKNNAYAAPGTHPPVKGGAKIDHSTGENIRPFHWELGLLSRDLRGQLERRPATGLAREGLQK